MGEEGKNGDKTSKIKTAVYGLEMNQICSGIWYTLIVTAAFITAVDYRWQALFSDTTGGNEIFPITQAVRGCGDHGKHRGIKARELHVQWEVLLEV